MDNVAGYVILALLLISGIYSVIIYNGLVSLKHNVSKAWSNIEVLLKQRHDELPKLVDVCKEYMGYERETLTRVMEARARVAAAQRDGDVKALGSAESEMRLGLGNLFAVAEAYPDLKANENFQHLQQRVTGLENAIADRREFYNESANINNIRVEQFPDVLVARLFNFRAFDLLEFTEEEKADVSIQALFG